MIPLDQNCGFFGFTLDTQSILDVEFLNREPTTNGEDFFFDNVAGVVCKSACGKGDPHFKVSARRLTCPTLL